MGAFDVSESTFIHHVSVLRGSGMGRNSALLVASSILWASVPMEGAFKLATRFLVQLKGWIGWSWTMLWTLVG